MVTFELLNILHCDASAGKTDAGHLLRLLDERVVLRDALQRQLLHQVDLVNICEPLLREVLDGDGEGGGEAENLAGRRHGKGSIHHPSFNRPSEF